jgi:hypothetical protein
MGPELSQRLGRAMGKASPAPTLDEREAVIDAAAPVDTFEELPAAIQELVLRLEASVGGTTTSARHLPGKHNQKDHAGQGGGTVDPQGDPSYHMPHTAPNSSYGATMNDPESMFPGIMEHPEAYATGDRAVDRESMAAVRKAVAGGPDTSITVYRAAPATAKDINPGDWVTPSKTYAEQHRDRAYDEGEGAVIKRTARAGDLRSVGDLAEWGWSPAEGRAEKA